MRRDHLLREKVHESVASVLPISIIVLILSVSIAPLSTGTLVLFLFGAVMVILGMGFFTLGADLAMMPMGEGIGVQMSRARKIIVPLLVCFVLGVIITMAEPDLQVLVTQMPDVPNRVLILTVAVGVGIFLLLAELRMLLKIPLSYVLVFFYGIVFILAIFSKNSFIPVSFDAGGVTTGPITVPFIMAMGVGMASVRSDKGSSSDSFGLISLCSIGPVLCMLLLGIFYKTDASGNALSALTEVTTTSQAGRAFALALPGYCQEVAVSILPITAILLVFQVVSRRFHRRQILKILAGLVYTYIGLVLFLTGVNVGFMPVGRLIGESLATGKGAWALVPVGMVIGFFIVRAEPAVGVLTHQVEDITNGAVPRRTLEISLSVAIALSAGIAMLRILTGVSILWFLIPGYVVALVMTFFVPQVYTGIAFDAGGVASGPMTSTFLLPLAIGACQARGGDVLTDAFGIVAMVAMMPLVTIQILGLVSRVRQEKDRRRPLVPIDEVEDCIIYFDR